MSSDFTLAHHRDQRSDKVSSLIVQTGREEIWPSGQNAKNQFGSSKAKQTKTVQIFIDTIGKSRISCIVKVGGVGIEDIMML